MNSFKNPLIPLITTPVNIDRPIQEIQVELANMGWLAKSFGRSWLAAKASPAILQPDKKIFYPHVWQGMTDEGKPRDFLEVLPNDNIISQSFFKVNDPIKILDYSETSDATMQANVDIIFWFNLNRIDPSIDYPYIELLKGQTLRALKQVPLSPDSSLSVLNIYETAANVWRGYNVLDRQDDQLTYPWGGFRFELQITFREDCPYDSYNLPPGVGTMGLTADTTQVLSDTDLITADSTYH